MIFDMYTVGRYIYICMIAYMHIYTHVYICTYIYIYIILICTVAFIALCGGICKLNVMYNAY